MQSPIPTKYIKGEIDNSLYYSIFGRKKKALIPSALLNDDRVITENAEYIIMQRSTSGIYCVY